MSYYEIIIKEILIYTSIGIDVFFLALFIFWAGFKTHERSMFEYKKLPLLEPGVKEIEIPLEVLEAHDKEKKELDLRMLAHSHKDDLEKKK